MPDDTPSLFRRPSVWSTVKAALAITVLSLAATQFLSGSRLDRGGMDRLVADASRNTRDPVTTGSIASAATLRLDPCAVAPRR
jgi:hypothetical protein